MENNRRKKIELLARLNRGRVAAPAFLEALSEALGDPVDSSALVPLPDSDALMRRFRDGYLDARKEGPFTYRRFFLSNEDTRVFRLADCLADRLGTEPAFLLSKAAETCGAVRVGMSTLLKHTASVIRIDGDSLYAMSADGAQGLLIDHNPDDHEQTFEVAVWGERWQPATLACDPK